MRIPAHKTGKTNRLAKKLYAEWAGDPKRPFDAVETLGRWRRVALKAERILTPEKK